MRKILKRGNNWPLSVPTELSCGRLRIGLLAIGRGWLAVEKPSGLSIHNDPGEDLRSLLYDCFRTDRTARDSVGFRPEDGLNAVNRLDRQTSGVVILATRPDVFGHIADQFKKRSVQKRYIAILHGILRAGRDRSKWFDWSWPLSGRAGGRRHPKGKGRLRKSMTRVRIEDHSSRYTLVQCEPVTGRKHQIRRHARLAGHAVVGDRRYGTLRSEEYLRKTFGFQRLALHCLRLDFKPPDRDDLISVQTEKIPDAINQLFNQDKKRSGHFDTGHFK